MWCERAVWQILMIQFDSSLVDNYFLNFLAFSVGVGQVWFPLFSSSQPEPSADAV
jgi:hypothetical protein